MTPEREAEIRALPLKSSVVVDLLHEIDLLRGVIKLGDYYISKLEPAARNAAKAWKYIGYLGIPEMDELCKVVEER
jgi:hypothetical protein